MDLDEKASTGVRGAITLSSVANVLVVPALAFVSR